tara:strand:+ start:2235 stop:2507 length:273 start_codon:yes stop_codon:yes gene_type:complete
MDYEKMTIYKLVDWIFKTSGYKVNYQDCKSRIENMCIKYARGEFSINGYGYVDDILKKQLKKEKLKLMGKFTFIGMIIGFLISLIVFIFS